MSTRAIFSPKRPIISLGETFGSDASEKPRLVDITNQLAQIELSHKSRRHFSSGRSILMSPHERLSIIGDRLLNNIDRFLDVSSLPADLRCQGHYIKDIFQYLFKSEREDIKSRSCHELNEIIRFILNNHTKEDFITSLADRCRNFKGENRKHFSDPLLELLENDEKDIVIYLLYMYLGEDFSLPTANPASNFIWLFFDDPEKIVSYFCLAGPAYLDSLDHFFTELSKLENLSQTVVYRIITTVCSIIRYDRNIDFICLSEYKPYLDLAFRFLNEIAENQDFSIGTELKRLQNFYVLDNTHINSPEVKGGKLTGLHILPDKGDGSLPKRFAIENEDSEVILRSPTLVDKHRRLAIGVFSYVGYDKNKKSFCERSKASTFFLESEIDPDTYVRAIFHILQNPLNEPVSLEGNRRMFIGQYTCENGKIISLLIWVKNGDRLIPNEIPSAYPVIIERFEQEEDERYLTNMIDASEKRKDISSDHSLVFGSPKKMNTPGKRLAEELKKIPSPKKASRDTYAHAIESYFASKEIPIIILPSSSVEDYIFEIPFSYFQRLGTIFKEIGVAVEKRDKVPPSLHKKRREEAMQSLGSYGGMSMFLIFSKRKIRELLS